MSPVTLKIIIDGDFPDDTMCNWIIHRAGILDLAGQISFQDTTRIELAASGERVLVEALEVACSLGPINAQVHSITSTQIPTPTAFYRQHPQFVRYSCPCPSTQANHQ